MKIITKKCRHGEMSFFDGDEFVGLSLELYGEYSEGEVIMLQKVLRPGDVAIDVGANIGALTVPMARLVGPTGKVIAYEPGREAYELLTANLMVNGLDERVDTRNFAASDTFRELAISPLDALGHKNYGHNEVGQGTAVTWAEPIDSLNLDRLKLLKIDVEGHELQVIKGATETIKRCQPIIYCENDRRDKAEALIGALVDLGYRLYWHRPPLFMPDNFSGNHKNVFGEIVSLNMVCVPEDSEIEVVGCEEVADIRVDDDMFNREIERHRRRVARDPDDLDSRVKVAHYCNLMQRDQEALEAINENLRRNPDHMKTKAILGFRQLQRGNWRAGWPAYEMRYEMKERMHFGGHRDFGVPSWNGEATDKVLLVSTEQGFGDTIMFSRFMREVLKRAPNAILEVQPQLFELMEMSGIVPPGRLYRMYRSLPKYDLQCSLPSLPSRLNADDELIRAVSHPYLKADPAMIEHWRSKRYRIGICANGSTRSERPMTRDLPLEYVEELGKEFGPFLAVDNNVGQFESFTDTAAALSALDLIIAVDTSVAHLAGALGKPVWLLMSFDPDWRWGLKGSSTIWYPTMRIFRQPKFRDWASVADQVAHALGEEQRKAA